MIETERLILRSWEERDRAAYAAFCADERVMATLGGVVDADIAGQRFERLRAADAGGVGILVIERRSGGDFLGYCGLLTVPDGRGKLAGEVEVAWGLVRDAWGQGYALEAADAVMAAAPHIAIYAYTASINERSRRVMERLGLTRRPNLDFENQSLPPQHPLRPHIVYLREAA